MYAIFKSGGKQYRAEAGAVVKLERLPGDVGEKVVLDQVLMLADGEKTLIGKPLVEDIVVRGRIVEQGLHKKILIFKHKRRKGYRKAQGHRQGYTAVLVEDIGGPVTAEPVTAQPEAAESE